MAKKKPGKKATPKAKAASISGTPVALLEDLRTLILQTRQDVAQAVNSALVLLYWQLGQRIRTEILQENRAAYGEEILATVSHKLAAKFGDGFSQANLSRMIRFAVAFSEQPMVGTLARHLSWSHFIEIIKLPEALQREFYAEMCRIERWSVRMLRAKVQSMLYERTALSR
jgi:hypothetical protein